MNPLQLHLLTNHVPVIGVLFAALALAAGLVSRSPGLRRFGLLCVIAVALAAVPVYLSGEPAEELLERSVTLPEPIVESHEYAAKVSMIALGLLGALALALHLRSRKRIVSGPEIAILLVATLGAAGTFAWTAHLGGQIRHSEIRAPMDAAAVSEGTAAGAAVQGSERDED